MKPLKKNKLSDPKEFIKLMVIIFVLVSVFLFSQRLSQEQIVINVLVILILFIGLQLTFLILYKKGVKSAAFLLFILLLMLGAAAGVGIWYAVSKGLVFQV